MLFHSHSEQILTFLQKKPKNVTQIEKQVHTLFTPQYSTVRIFLESQMVSAVSRKILALLFISHKLDKMQAEREGIWKILGELR